jgi:hypothetical protein
MTWNMTYRVPAGITGLAALVFFGSAWSQGSGCPDDFSASGIGEGKTWKLIDADKSTAGSGAVAGGKLELSGRGADVYGKKNEFVAVYRSDIQGDFDVSVKLESQDNTHAWAQAGIVAATDLNDLSKGGYVALDISPGNGFNVFFDKSAPTGELDGNLGAGKTAYPAWLRLSKKGLQFSAWYKTQASAAWTALPSPSQSLGTQANSQIGLFTVSHDTTKTAKAVFDDFECLNGTTGMILPRKIGHGIFKPTAPPGKWVDVRGKAQSRTASQGSERLFPAYLFPAY